MHRKFLFTVGTAIGAAFLTAAFAVGQSAGTTDDQNKTMKSGTTASTTTLTASDRAFVMEAAKGGLAEVEMGRLAAEKASNPDVKSFGQRMVDDHSKANDELKALAQQKGIQIPTDLDAKDKATRDKLAKLSGDAFDKAYMADMVKDHKTDVNEFKKESQQAKDADIKAFAGKTLPTLEDHLKMAEETHGKVSGAKPAPATKKSGYSW